MWHGQVMVPVPGQVMYFQEKFKQLNQSNPNQIRQSLIKGLDTEKMYKKIDFLIDFLGSNVYKQNYFEYAKFLNYTL